MRSITPNTVTINTSRHKLCIGQTKSNQEMRVSALTQPEAMYSGQVADSELQRRIVNFLFERGPTSLRHLETEVRGGVVVITGRVRTYYEKQLATCCCQRVAGVFEVINEVRVVEPASAGTGRVSTKDAY